MAFLVLPTALVTAAVGQVAYKRFFRDRAIPALVVAGATFAVAQLAYFLSLRVLPVGVVYMASSVTHAIVLGLSHFYLKEDVTRHHLAAVGLIAAGLVLYAA